MRRTRFAPVKTTDDLLVSRSDAYELSDDGVMVPRFDGPPLVISLDKRFYGRIDDFEARFPSARRRCDGVRACASPATCGSGPTSRGWAVEIDGPLRSGRYGPALTGPRYDAAMPCEPIGRSAVLTGSSLSLFTR